MPRGIPTLVDTADENQILVRTEIKYEIVKAKVKRCAKQKNLVIEVPAGISFVMEGMQAEVFLGHDTDGKPYIKYARFAC